MGKVVILDENTANQIAAGEVIERPASVVKEMIENSLDANATSISVEILNGGIKSIKIADNGDGIDADDVEIAFERHATSKIRTIDDLNRISTMGFRGEALASIASVAKVEVITKTENAKTGTRAVIEGGRVLLCEPTGAPKGTTFIVRELFYNTPARYKFLKKDSTEAGYIHDIITRIALARPDVSIKLINQGKTVLHTPGNYDLQSTIYSLFGKETARAVIPLNLNHGGVEVSGYIGKPEISRGNRSLEMVFVNGRSVYNKVITAAIEDAYKTRLMQKRFPFTVLKLNISPEAVDVNVHPAKLEVRFSDENLIYRAVYMAVSEALSGTSLIQNIEEESDDTEAFSSREIKNENKAEQIKIDDKPVNRVNTDIKMPAVNPVIYNVKKDNDCKGEKKELTDKNTDSNIVRDYLNVRNTAGIFSAKPEPSEREHDVKVKQDAESFYYQPKANVISRPVQESNPVQESFEPEVQDDRQRLLSARIIGQAFETYIILEEGEDVFVIDQHAAHERIRFEKIKKEFKQAHPYSQGLLSPLTVELTELEMQKFSDLTPYLKKLGFEAEIFGSRTVLVRAIPYILGDDFSGRDFRDILDKLSQEVNGVLEIIPEETIYTMACKSAIKANRTMSQMEIESLIKELVSSENPYTCVHGRPIIISINKKELEKKFKRIV